MAITKANLKTFKSDTMVDTSDGGGEITAEEIEQGVPNNIFEDVSSGDRTTGGVKLRKVYQHVTSQNGDVYLSGRAVITQIPLDGKVGITAFTTGDNHDRRAAARSRIEGYRSKGSKYLGFLFSTQYKFSKVITIFQSELVAIPQIADVLYLTQLNDTENQYVKIVNVEDSLETFTRVEGGQTKTFQRRIVTIEISQQLKYDFVGADISESDEISPQATILNTIIADAARYYSARPLAEAAALSDTSVKVDTIYSQLVPSGLRETGTASVDPITFAQVVTPATQTPITLSTNATLESAESVALGSPIVPSSLTVTAGLVTLTDRGGALLDNGVEVASIDYVTGVIVFNADSPVYSGTKYFEFTPGAKTVGSSDTAMIDITNGNRGNVYTMTIIPAPQPGTTVVQFISLGSWYTLRDNGNGDLVATEDGIGIGTIDYNTGSIILTLEVLPDEGGAIIFTWGTGTSTVDSSAVTLEHPFINVDLSYQPTALTLTWNDGSARTATLSGGAIIGHATGTLKGRRLSFMPTRLPPKGTEITITGTGTTHEESSLPVPSPVGNQLVGTLPNSADIIPGSMSFRWTLILQALYSGSAARWINPNGVAPERNVYAHDDGAGNIISDIDGATIGTVDYVTGDVDWDGAVSLEAMKLTGTTVHGDHFSDGVITKRVVRPGAALVAPEVFPVNFGGANDFTVNYSVSATTNPYLDTVVVNDFSLPLQQPLSALIAPNSLRFTFGGRDYVTSDDSDSLTSNYNISTRDGVLSGSVDRTNGVALITDWTTFNSSVLPVMVSMASYKAVKAVSQLIMRIPNPPVRTQSFQLRATDIDTGTVYVGDADANGDIVGAGIDGTINYETGVVEARFGVLVTAAGNEAEWWYDASDIDGGQIFKPNLVDSSDIRYDAVVQKFVPLDETVIGMNPVRLPEDGRVPVFNLGDSVFIMNTQKLTQVFTSSTQTDLGRTDIASIVVTDANGDLVVGTAFNADTAAGTIDWGDLTAVVQPITVMHRIEVERILEDVQITGKLTLNEPVPRAFPLADSIVTSAILHGDMVASVSTPFSQKTWTNEWSSILIGDGILAQYNDANFPILLDNRNAVAERWLIVFKSANTVDVVGEYRGVVLENVSIQSAIAPVNPATGFPYFTMQTGGWGLGWSSGNVLRFDTLGAYKPIWLIESIGQGDATDTSADALKFCMEFKGDTNTQ